MLPQTLFAWLLVATILASAYPLARALLAFSPLREGTWLTVLLALGLAVGILTLLMFWMGLFGAPYDAGAITLAYGLCVGIGTMLLRRMAAANGIASKALADGKNALQVMNTTYGTDDKNAVPTAKSTFGTLHFALRTLYFVLLLIAASILFNAVYFPFSRDDAVGIYLPLAQIMTEARTLAPLLGADSLYRAYPMSIPLAYTFTFLASGWENHYLAKLIPTLLSIGCIPAAALLGRRLSNAPAGTLAALLLALMPAFGSWASSGYVDLPMGFYYTLAALFMLRLRVGGAFADALLAGVCMGLAAWTKNNALIGVGAVGLWLGLLLVLRRIPLRHAVSGMLACAVVAAPWYVRNLLGAGFIMPDTAWIDQARPSLDNLFIFATVPNNFGVSGWALLAGLAWATWQLIQGKKNLFKRGREEAGGGATDVLILLIGFAPFFAAWWALASYDPRFLQALLPLGCALGGAALAWAWARLREDWRRVLRVVLLVGVLVLTAERVYYNVEFKDELLRNPLMTHEEKLALVETR
jgi:4-amino-4-deoxy-L-arabinose transferase-like glycosyltransferase